MPQNTDSNNPDKTGAAGLAPGSNNFLNEYPDPPGQNDTRIVEIGQIESEMNPEAQVLDGDTITTTTSTATIDNYNEHANDRHAKRNAIDIREEEFDTETMGIRKELHVDEDQINEVQGRIKMDKDMIQKLIDGIKALKQGQDELVKENARLTKENAKLVSMVNYLTLKANELDGLLDQSSLSRFY
jgi:uncharacterized phage infection (PIP) family protein YhgE